MVAPAPVFTPYDMESIRADEVRFRTFMPDGSVSCDCRFRLRAGTRVQSQLTNLFPQPIAIGDTGRDTHPFTSTNTRNSGKQGIGLLIDDPSQPERVAFATADLRYSRQITLPKLKTHRPSPAAEVTSLPLYGITYGSPPTVHVCFGAKVYTWSDAGVGSWTLATTLPAVPVGEPILYGADVYWPCGAAGMAHWNGTTLVTHTNATINGVVGGCVYNARIYYVRADGAVYRTNANDYAMATLTQVGGVQAISDTPTGMFVYFDAANKATPYVVGRRVIYAIDETLSLIVQSGPELNPSRHTLRVAVLGADRHVYMGQGMSTIQWTGEQATSVGLDEDDGLPIQFRGGIVKVLNGNLSLFELVDATAAPTTSYAFGSVATSPAGGRTMRNAAGYSAVFSREGSAWVVRASSEPTDTSPSMMFISATPTHYRLWFAWGRRVYSIDLEEGLFNPLDDPTGEYEPSAFVVYPRMDFGYKEEQKIALQVNVRVKNIEASGNKVQVSIRFDDTGGYIILGTLDGAAGSLNGLHTFNIHANPDLATIETPAVGYPHDFAQIRLDLTRDPANTRTTPVVEYVDYHVVKVMRPIEGWRFAIDLNADVDGRTPFENRAMLHRIIHDAASRLVHFSYIPGDGVADSYEGVPDVRAVKFTGQSQQETTGLSVDYEGVATLVVSEVI